MAFLPGVIELLFLLVSVERHEVLLFKEDLLSAPKTQGAVSVAAQKPLRVRHNVTPIGCGHRSWSGFWWSPGGPSQVVGAAGNPALPGLPSSNPPSLWENVCFTLSTLKKKKKKDGYFEGKVSLKEEECDG